MLDRNKPRVAGIGYIGYGKYNSKHSSYNKWNGMLRRVIADDSLSVCDEWLNFQNFAQWYDNNFPLDGELYDLDKDIIDFGNRMYCPEKCKFVSRKENVRFKKVMYASVVIDPNGIEHKIFNQTQFAKDNGLDANGLNMVIKGHLKSHKKWRLKKVI